jgi:hypothetical protein
MKNSKDVNLIIAQPYVFHQNDLKSYEEKILDNPNANERTASNFFCDFPKFLSIGGYREIRPEVMLCKPEKGEIFRVDFLRRQLGTEYWDIVELKPPHMPFIVKKGKHWKLNSQVEGAINQVQDYVDFLNEEINRDELESRTGIKCFMPKVLVVAGCKGQKIESDDFQKILSRYRQHDIVSYDDLYNFAKECYESNVVLIPIMMKDPPNILEFVEQKDSRMERIYAEIESEKANANMEGCTYCVFGGSHGMSGHCRDCSNREGSGFF